MVRVKLVGCNFHPASKKTIENEVVKVMREPTNKFDKDAIVVKNSLGETIGYVGTTKTVTIGNRNNGCIDNIQLGNLMKDNFAVRGIVTKFRDYFGFIEVDL